jgi:hypothetical protein
MHGCILGGQKLRLSADGALIEMTKWSIKQNYFILFQYDSKLLKLQKQTSRVQQNAAASSNQEIFRKKLQHAKSEYESEISGLKRTISDLENQASRSGAANSSKTGPLQLKKRKF